MSTTQSSLSSSDRLFDPGDRFSSGKARFDLAFEKHFRPAPGIIRPAGNIVRCVGLFRDTSTVIDVDPLTGAEVARVEKLPLMTDMAVTEDGWTLGFHRVGVGRGNSRLFFLSPESRLISEIEVAGATTEVASVDDLWLVGCRNGRLYAFDRQGHHKWIWQIPESEHWTGSPYMRPCPYLVCSCGDFCVVA